MGAELSEWHDKGLGTDVHGRKPNHLVLGKIHADKARCLPDMKASLLHSQASAAHFKAAASGLDQDSEVAIGLSKQANEESSKESANMLNFISQKMVSEAVQYLASGTSLPYTKADGQPNHNLMGAAWAALHGGYRGNKYAGDDKAAAIAKLTKLYKSEGMDTPEESFSVTGAMFIEAALPKSQSHSALQDAVSKAINDNIRVGVDMDCDDDGDEDAKQGKYAYVLDMFPGAAVYSMDGKTFQVPYTVDRDDDIHLGTPSAVEQAYVDKENKDKADEADKGIPACAKCGAKCASCAKVAAKADESFAESFGGFDLQEAAGASPNSYTVTVIKPGWSKNNRFYSEAMLKRDHKIFEGAKMFADHATDAEAKAKPEGSVNNWVGNLKDVHVEADGTVKGTAVVIDPTFDAKLQSLKKAALLDQMGTSIRAMGEANDGEAGGRKGKIVEALKVARSVDFVTFAGAGGKVDE